MKRAIFLATTALLVMMMMAPAALAQEDSMMEESMMEDSMMEESMMEDSMMEETGSGMGSDSDLPSSGGPAILLPAAALLLGSGILTFAVLRRR